MYFLWDFRYCGKPPREITRFEEVAPPRRSGRSRRRPPPEALPPPGSAAFSPGLCRPHPLGAPGPEPQVDQALHGPDIPAFQRGLHSASGHVAAAEEVQELLMNPRFRIYVSGDAVGVELGGALKNVIALAAGICDGLEVGDNTKAALMTRGLAEVARLGIAMGARSETFAGLSGMGDLVVTCGSMHSRNRRAGILIGQGFTAEQAVKQVGTVEGYCTVRPAVELARQQGVEMPIMEQCCRICYEGQEPRAAVKALFDRPLCYESEKIWSENCIHTVCRTVSL